MEKTARLQMAVLSINSEKFPLYEGVNTIGRNREAVVNIKHMNISQSHAIVVIINGQHFISDLKSSNGSFYENSRMVPFKLYQLQDDAEVIIGGLSGRYRSKGPFSGEEKSSNDILISSQSFYGCNTQLLESSASQTIDFHDAPTQEISWAFVKPKDILAKKHQNESNLIADSNHSVLQDSVPLLADEFNDENLPFLENSNNFIGTNLNVEINEETTGGEESTEIIKLKKSPERAIIEDDETTDCEGDGNIDLKNISNEVNALTKPLIHKDNVTECQVLPQSEDSNDSIDFLKVEKSLTNNAIESCLNNTTDAEAKAVSSDSETEVFVGKRTKKSFMVISTQDIYGESSNSLSNQSDVDDSLTEEINPQVSTKPKYNDSFVEQDKTLKASIHLEDSIPPTQNETVADVNDSDFISTTPEVSRCLNYDVGVSKKCVKLTESIQNGKEIQEAPFEHNIQSVENESAADFNESDFIPATQEVSKYLINKSQNRNKNTGSSEESFKLELTELITGSSQGVNDISKMDECFQGNTNIYEASTQKIITKDNDKVEPIQSIATDDTFLAKVDKDIQGNPNVCDAPTQKIITKGNDEVEPIHSSATDDTSLAKMDASFQGNTNVYDAPTQDIISKNINQVETIHSIATNDPFLAKMDEDFQDNTNVYDAPTQKINIKNNDEVEPISSIPTDDRLLAKIDEGFQGNTNVYDAATQKIIIKDNNEVEPINSIATDEQYLAKMDEGFQGNTNVYDAPTQNIISKNINEVESIHSIATNDPFLAKMDEGFQGNTNVYDAPTQKINIKNNDEVEPINSIATNDSFLAKMDEGFQGNKNVYDAPTQKIIIKDEFEPINSVATDDTFLVATQKINLNKLDSVTILSKNESNNYEENTDIYDAPTQMVQINLKSDNEIDIELKDCNVKSIAEETDAFFSAPTQKIHNFDNDMDPLRKSTEQLNDIPKKVSVGNKKPKKKFNFVKKPFDLDASLSALVDNKPVESNIDKNIASTSAQNIYDKMLPICKSKRGLDDSSTTDILKNNEHLDVPKNIDIPQNSKDSGIKGQRNEINTETTFNVTNSDINKSIAMLESKITKTRKSKRTPNIKVTVPKTRRTMSISSIEETPELSRSESKSSVLTERTDITSDLGKSLTTSDGRRASGRNRVSTTKTLDLSKKETSKRNSKKLNVPSKNTSKSCISESNQSNSDISSGSALSVEIPIKRSSRRNLKAYSINNNVIEESTEDNQNYNVNEANTSAHSKTKTLIKRKNTSEVDKVASTTSKKAKLQFTDNTPNSKQRGLRKQRPKVVFTMMESPQLESLIKQLGGSVVESVESCTVLVTEHVKRSQKLLSAIGLGKPICSPKWITDSKKAQEFLDPWDYILTDPEAEKKWDFSLKESLNRSKANKLLESCHFYIQVTNGAEVLKGAIESCGGTCLPKLSATPLEDAYIISSSDNRSKYSRITKKHPYFTVIEAEAIFDGVLRQELRCTRHILR